MCASFFNRIIVRPLILFVSILAEHRLRCGPEPVQLQVSRRWFSSLRRHPNEYPLNWMRLKPRGVRTIFATIGNTIKPRRQKTKEKEIEFN